jgi:hypothetical protein
VFARGDCVSCTDVSLAAPASIWQNNGFVHQGAINGNFATKLDILYVGNVMLIDLVVFR